MSDPLGSQNTHYGNHTKRHIPVSNYCSPSLLMIVFLEKTVVRVVLSLSLHPIWWWSEWLFSSSTWCNHIGVNFFVGKKKRKGERRYNKNGTLTMNPNHNFCSHESSLWSSFCFWWLLFFQKKDANLQGILSLLFNRFLSLLFIRICRTFFLYDPVVWVEEVIDVQILNHH